MRDIVNEGGELEGKAKTLGEVFPKGGGDLKEAISKEEEDRKQKEQQVLEQLEKEAKDEEDSSESVSRDSIRSLSELTGSLKVGNVWVFVQPRTKNQPTRTTRTKNQL